MILIDMIANNNFSVLAFHASLAEQSHRMPYAYGDIFPLYVPVGHIPTFQIYDVTGFYTNVGLYKADGTYIGWINPAVSLCTVDGTKILVHDEHANEAQYTGEGQYYIVVEINGVSYYSDVFTAVADITPYLRVEWWDETDFIMDGAAIAYVLQSALYHNVVFLNTQLGKPGYDFEEEGETRDGLFFPSKMLSEKTYKFQFLANEPLCDVMRLARMADHVKVTDRYGNVYDCDTFLITPKWETQGNLASVEAEFQTNLVAKRIGRAFT
jgi:hypothetical protein